MIFLKIVDKYIKANRKMYDIHLKSRILQTNYAKCSKEVCVKIKYKKKD